MSSSSKGEISTLFLNCAMVSAFLMTCGIIFQALGAVYKTFFLVCSNFSSCTFDGGGGLFQSLAKPIS